MNLDRGIGSLIVDVVSRAGHGERVGDDDDEGVLEPSSFRAHSLGLQEVVASQQYIVGGDGHGHGHGASSWK